MSFVQQSYCSSAMLFFHNAEIIPLCMITPGNAVSDFGTAWSLDKRQSASCPPHRFIHVPSASTEAGLTLRL